MENLIVVTADTALRLARFFGLTPELWLNLQSFYELRSTCFECGEKISRDVYPYAD